MIGKDDILISARILSISIENFKNIANGRIDLGTYENLLNNKSDICGIYGQNGTGKTSVIEAIKIMKDLMIGRGLPTDVKEYIMDGKESVEISLSFFIDSKFKEYIVDYSIAISKIDIVESEFYGLKSEILELKERGGANENWSRKKTLIKKVYSSEVISPKYRDDELADLFKNRFDYEYIQRVNIERQESFIFDKTLEDKICKNNKGDSDLRLIYFLKTFAAIDLHIIDSKDIALSSANIILPLNFNYRDEKSGKFGVIPIGLSKAEPIPSDALAIVKNVISEMNNVLKEIIPGLTICTKELASVIDEDGIEKIPVELLSCRENSMIPIRYESDGIKKIISVLNLIINMYNNPSMVILIDELDAGIFEYLLGEILLILEESGKGQLIFTSHNLRPLEVLNKNNLVFTTTNTENRYIKLKNIRPNNNMRDVYYRDIILDGQDESIYERTSSAMIKRALRKAGEVSFGKKE